MSQLTLQFIGHDLNKSAVVTEPAIWAADHGFEMEAVKTAGRFGREHSLAEQKQHCGSSAFLKVADLRQTNKRLRIHGVLFKHEKKANGRRCQRKVGSSSMEVPPYDIFYVSGEADRRREEADETAF